MCVRVIENFTLMAPLAFQYFATYSHQSALASILFLPLFYLYLAVSFSSFSIIHLLLNFCSYSLSNVDIIAATETTIFKTCPSFNTLSSQPQRSLPTFIYPDKHRHICFYALQLFYYL